MIKKLQKNQIEDVLLISNSEFKNLSWTKNQFIADIENIYVYILDNKIVGFVVLLFAIDEMTILNIAVKNEYKKQKIATKLLKFSENLAKKQQISKIFLEVEQNNTPAKNFYEKMGFEYLRKRENYYKNHENCYEMCKKIDF